MEELSVGTCLAESAPQGSEITRPASLVPILRIGSLDGDLPTAFGRIDAIAVGRRGLLFAFDGMAHELRVFDESGGLVRTLGREGDGPGEFRGVIGMTHDSSNRLWIVDGPAKRYTLVDQDSVVEMRSRPVDLYNVPWVGGFLTDGTLIDATVRASDGGQVLIGVVEEGGSIDTVLAAQPNPDTPRRRMMSFPLPFSSRLLSVVDPGGFVWTATSDRYHLTKLSLGGDTIAEVSRALLGRPLSPVERDSVSAYVAELAGLGVTVPESGLPVRKPILDMLAVSPQGELWVFHQDSTGGYGGVDIYGAGGERRCSLEMPFELVGVAPVVREDRVYGVTVDDYGVPYLVAAEIR